VQAWDEVVIFKALVLQALYNLSGDQAEYQLRDRFSFMRFFMRFLGLELEDAVPDAKTLWLYREALAKRKNPGTVELLGFLQALRDRGYSPDKTLRGTKDWIDIAQVTLFKRIRL
jgi:transposase, IS5 family